MAKGGRNYKKVDMRANKYCIAEDMIRVGCFLSRPIRYGSMRLSRSGRPIPVLRVAQIVPNASGLNDAAEALNEGLRIGKDKKPFDLYRDDTLKKVLCEMIHGIVTYDEYLEIRRDGTGLGVYFRQPWPRGKTLGLQSDEGSWVQGHRTHFQGPFASHDGHSTANGLNAQAMSLNRPEHERGRPYQLLGLGAFLNHGCRDHAHFVVANGWFRPFLCNPQHPGKDGEALVCYSEHEDLPCKVCRKVLRPKSS
jgi:hypothetical protein